MGSRLRTDMCALPRLPSGANSCRNQLCPQVLGEYGLTNVLMSHGYNVATLMARYRPVRLPTAPAVKALQ